MKIFTQVLTQIMKFLTGSISRFIPFYTKRILIPIQKIKADFMQNFFTLLKKIFTHTHDREMRTGVLNVGWQPDSCCVTTNTNNIFPDHKNGVAENAASFAFIPQPIHRSEKKIFMKTVLQSCKRFAIVLFLLIATLLFTKSSFAQTVLTNPTSPWTVPAGVTSVKVEVWGAGGGGGGSRSTSFTNAFGGGGGGGGSYTTSTFTVSAGQTYTITYGAGGTAGAATPTAGGTGGTTTFTGTGGTVSSAGGGGGGAGNNANGTAGTAGVGGINGGTGGASTGNGAGGGGGAGNNGVGTNGGNASTGAGGPGNPNVAPYIGGGGGGFLNGTGTGNSGSVTGPGGGGGGGRATNTTRGGGAGGAGQVVLTFCTPYSIATSTVAATPVCGATTTTVTVNSNAASLPAGTYTVTYTLDNPVATNTATMTVNGSGVGTFTATGLTSPGTVNLAITFIGNANCGNTAISANNTSSLVVGTVPATPATPLSNSPQCVDVGVTLTENGTAPGTDIWYWQGTSVTGKSTANPATSIFNATTSGTYFIQALSSSGCWSAEVGVAVVVNPLPNATISGSTSVCLNATPPNVTFTGSGGTAPYTFTYSIFDGTNTTTGLTTSGSPSATVPAPTGVAGTFTYTLLSVHDATTTQCSKTITGQTAIINVVAPPSVSDFHISASTTYQTIGDGIVVTSSSLASGTYTVIYNLTGANTATGNTATLIFNAGTGTFNTSALANKGNTTITVTGISSSVCSNVAVTGTNTATFLVAIAFTASNTFNTPAGVTSILVEAWGAGAGGCRTCAPAGGGGGGAYASTTITNPSTTYAVVVGTGGGAGANGGNSSFGGAILVANGGLGSTSGGFGGAATVGAGITSFAGGNGVTGTGNGGGAAGSAAGQGANANGTQGGIGVDPGGSGGNGGTNGGTGTSFGGGGGAASTGTSGTGANGAVGLVFTCPLYSIDAIVAAKPAILGGASVVTVTSSTMPNGTYTITYNLSGANSATNQSSTLTFNNGTGTFNTISIANGGSTTVSVTNISSGTPVAFSCSNAINATSSFIVSIMTFNTNGTFTVPTGVTCIQVQAWGAGGGGGGGVGGSGGGGGGGAYTLNNSVLVTPGNTYNIAIGQGGIGGQNAGNTNNTGNPGTATSATFDGAVTVTANPGQGGTFGTGTSVSGGAGGTGGTYSGGAGGVGNSTLNTGGTGDGGGGGSSAGTGAVGNAGGTPTAGTAVTGGGPGGVGATGTNTGSNPASGPGGGGGGGSKTSGTSTRAGGNGANGQMIITWIDISNFNTSATSPACFNGTSAVTLTSTTLLNGTYTVSYDINGNNHNASLNFNNGTGTFITTALTDPSSVVTIDQISFVGASCGQSPVNNQATIAVIPAPTATAGGSHEICQNGSYTLQSGEATASNSNILWTSNGNGTILDATTLTPTYNAVALDGGHTVTLTLTVTANSPCTSAATDTYSIIVDASPTAVSGGNHTICANTSYTLQAGEASASNGAILWTSNGAGTLSGETTLTPTYNAVTADGGNTVTLTLTVAGNNACSALTPQATYSILVNPSPSGTFGIILNQTYCSGDPNQADVPLFDFNFITGNTSTFTIEYSDGTTTYQPTPQSGSEYGDFITPAPTATTQDITYTYTLTKITDGNGCVSSISDPLTQGLLMTDNSTTQSPPLQNNQVLVHPPAAVTSVTGDQTPLCIGSTTTFTANGVVLGGGTGAWSSSDNTVATVDANGVVTAVGAGTANIIYTVTGGCNGTPTQQLSISVNADAAVTSVTGDQTPLCIGSTTTFTANGVVLGGGTGAWSSSDNTVATVDANGVVTAVGAGTANIIYTVTGGCNGTPTQQLSISVNADAAVTSVTGDQTPLCIGSTTTFTANGVVLGGGTGAWSSSDNTVATVDANGVVTAVGAGTANIIYTVTGGCNGTPTQQLSISVNADAAVTSVTGDQTPLCIGSTTTFTANGVVLGGGTGAWSSSDNTVATVDANGVVTAVGAGTANIIYTVTGGCNGTPTQQLSISVNADAAVTSVTGDQTPLCIGSTTTFTANGVVLGGGTGAWGSSDNTVATVDANGVVTAVGAGTANIIYTVTGGCNGTPTQQLSISVNADAAVTSVTGDQTPLCIGSTTTFTANGVVLGGGTGAWGSSDNTVATVDANGVVTAVGAGTANIIYTVTGGCNGTPTQQLSISVNADAAVTSVTGDQTPLCIGSTTTFTANGVVLGGGTGAWSSSDNTVATVDANGVVTAVGAGTANIIYTVTGGCNGTPTQQLSISVNADAAVTSVTGDQTPLCIGSTTTFTANGVVLGGGTGAWGSSDNTVATVDANGVVTAVGAGTANIIYTVTGGCNGTPTQQLSISVNADAAVTSVTGDQTPLCIGSTTTFTANGVVLGGGTGAWSSSDNTVATVDANGVVTAVGAGTANIIYTVTGGCNGTPTQQLSISVNADAAVTSVTGDQTPLCIGSTTTFTANGVVLGGGTGAWSSSDNTVATVDANGVVTAVGAGTANIIYTVTGGCNGTPTQQLSISVNADAAVTSVTGDQTPLCIGSTTTFTANGVVLGGGTGAWSSSDNTVATVDANGVVTAVGAGTANIIYTVTGGCNGTPTQQLSISVNADAAVTSVTGDQTPLCIGSTTTFTANGVVLGGGTGAWSSSDNTVATVDANGVVTAVGAGTANIIYTVTGGCNGTPTQQLSISVNADAAVTSVTGDQTPLCIGSTTTFTANGVVLGGGTGAWSSSDNTVATVDANGVVTAVGAGTANIIYTVTGGCNGTPTQQLSISVNADAAVTSVTGDQTPLCIGSTTTFTANGVVLGGGTGAWSSSDNTVATVDANGVVTAVGAGTANIIYTVTGGCNGTPTQQLSISVNADAAVTSVTGDQTPLCIGSTTTFTANGVVLGGGTGAWSSSDNTVATVDANGVVTAVGAGTANIIYTVTGGCNGTPTQQLSISVNADAAVTSVTGDQTPLCIGSATTFTANGVVLGGGTGAWSSE